MDLDLGNPDIASAATVSLMQWIAAGAKIPLQRGRLNRSAICTVFLIGRSCLRTNSQLANEFDVLDGGFRKSQINPTHHQASSPMESKFAELEAKLALIFQRLAAFEYLLQAAEKS